MENWKEIKEFIYLASYVFGVLTPSLGALWFIFRLSISPIGKDVERIEKSVDKLSEDLKIESRDFHGRLCSLEEKYKILKS